MANSFLTFSAKEVGATSTEIYHNNVSGKETTAIGLNIANVLAVSITVDVEFYDGGNSATERRYIVKDAIVPVGSSLVAIGGDQKIVLTNGDRLKVKASQASACDVVLSVLEIT